MLGESVDRGKKKSVSGCGCNFPRSAHVSTEGLAWPQAQFGSQSQSTARATRASTQIRSAVGMSSAFVVIFRVYKASIFEPICADGRSRRVSSRGLNPDPLCRPLLIETDETRAHLAKLFETILTFFCMDDLAACPQSASDQDRI